MMKNYKFTSRLVLALKNNCKYLFLFMLLTSFSFTNLDDKCEENKNYSLAPGDINPIELTGFNHDVIANGVGTMASSTTIELDDDSFCLLSEDWKLTASSPAITVGLPSNGEIVSSVAGLTYKFSPMTTPYDGNNSLRLSGVSNGTLMLTTPFNYEKIYILVTSGSNASNVNVKLKFDDNTTQTFSNFTVPDWFQTGLPVEASGFGRGDVSNNNVETPAGNPKLFRIEVQLSQANQLKNLSEITFEKTNSGTSVLNVFAVSGKESATCPSPTNVVFANNTDTSVDVSWNESGTATEWEILYGETGFDIQTAGQTVNDNDGTIGETLTNLQPDTFYDVYVRAICTGESSNWTSVKSFTTLETPCAIPSNIMITNITQSTADISWTENGSATEWTVSYGFPGFNPNTQGNSVVDDDGTLGVTLQNLNMNTSYDVYVFAHCDTSDSENSEVESFTTEELSLRNNIFSNFTYYPNPTYGDLTVKANEKIRKITVYNLLGEKMIELNNVKAHKTISLNKLHSGMYLMKVNINGFQKVFRIIKD